MATTHWLQLHKVASEEFGRRIAAVVDWEAPTPDTEWNVADLVAHVIAEQRSVPDLIARAAAASGRSNVVLQPFDKLPSDGAARAWNVFSAAAFGAFSSVPLDASLNLSRDVMTIEEFVIEQTSDIAIHTWDLARATGSDEALPEGLVRAVWSHFEPQIDSLAASGLYAPPVGVDTDAPLLIRLLAITGRDGRSY